MTWTRSGKPFPICREGACLALAYPLVQLFFLALSGAGRDLLRGDPDAVILFNEPMSSPSSHRAVYKRPPQRPQQAALARQYSDQQVMG